MKPCQLPAYEPIKTRLLKQKIYIWVVARISRLPKLGLSIIFLKCKRLVLMCMYISYKTQRILAAPHIPLEILWQATTSTATRHFFWKKFFIRYLVKVGRKEMRYENLR